MKNFGKTLDFEVPVLTGYVNDVFLSVPEISPRNKEPRRVSLIGLYA